MFFINPFIPVWCVLCQAYISSKKYMPLALIEGGNYSKDVFNWESIADYVQLIDTSISSKYIYIYTLFEDYESFWLKVLDNQTVCTYLVQRLHPCAVLTRKVMKLEVTWLITWSLHKWLSHWIKNKFTDDNKSI